MAFRLLFAAGLWPAGFLAVSSAAGESVLGWSVGTIISIAFHGQVYYTVIVYVICTCVALCATAEHTSRNFLHQELVSYRYSSFSCCSGDHSVPKSLAKEGSVI